MGKKRKGILLPGHNYVGPGNDLDGVEAVDNDDSIARLHDEDYDRGASVPISDDIAISLFADEARKGSIHSIIGALGLSLKRILELGFGTIYDGGRKAVIYENDVRDAASKVGKHYPSRDLIDQLADPSHPDHVDARIAFNIWTDLNSRYPPGAESDSLVHRSPVATDEEYRRISRVQQNTLNHERNKRNFKAKIKNWIDQEKRKDPKLNSKHGTGH